MLGVVFVFREMLLLSNVLFFIDGWLPFADGYVVISVIRRRRRRRRDFSEALSERIVVYFQLRDFFVLVGSDGDETRLRKGETDDAAAAAAHGKRIARFNDMQSR